MRRPGTRGRHENGEPLLDGDSEPRGEVLSVHTDIVNQPHAQRPSLRRDGRPSAEAQPQIALNSASPGSEKDSIPCHIPQTSVSDLTPRTPSAAGRTRPPGDR